MADEDERRKQQDKDEKLDDEEDEELSEEERWKRKYLRRIAEQAAKKFEKSGGRKVDAGFQGAFSGQENAHKYYRHHSNAFKYGAEPKDKVPKTKPLGKPPEGFSEPSRWIPPHAKEFEKIEAEAKQAYTPEIDAEFVNLLRDLEKVDPLLSAERTAKGIEIDILEKSNNEHGRQPDGAHKAHVQKEESKVNQNIEINDDNEDLLRVDIDTSLHSADRVASQVSSQLEKAGFKPVSAEIQRPSEIEANAETKQLAEFLDIIEDPERVDELLGGSPEINSDITIAQPEVNGTESSISPLELNETHEKLRRKAIGEILEEQRLELLDDFELGPEHVDNVEEEYY